MSVEAWGLGRRCLLSWQACHLQHLRFHLRGRRATFSTYIDVCGSVAPGTPLRFVVAGVALAAPHIPFAWQACYFQRLHRCPFAWQACYFQYTYIDVCGSVAPGTPLRFVVAVALAAPRRFHLRGRRAAFSTYIDVCGSHSVLSHQACC